MLRRPLVLALAALLGGCGNIVYSEAPLFSRADHAGVPAFRPGLWAMPEPNCDFDPALPFAAWPSCANGTPMDKRGPVEGSVKKSSSEYLIAAGDPLIVQHGAKDEHQFFYTALKPMAFDARRRITGAEMWPVQCGPPPPGDDAKATNRRLTLELQPGLEAQGDNCLVRDRAALLAAARASRAWSPETITARWMREGDH